MSGPSDIGVMGIITLVIAWFLIGALLGIRESRRGHWHWLWVLGAMAGPFAIPLYRQIEQNERLSKPITLRSGTRQGHPGIRVLAGIDGSEASVLAARQAADLLGARLGDLTLAAVADFEISETLPPEPQPGDTRDVAYATALADAARQLDRWLSFEPATVLLVGRPATALVEHATREHFDLIAVGTSGHGITKRVLGSCASQLTHETSIPVLLLPSATTATNPADDASATTRREDQPR